MQINDKIYFIISGVRDGFKKSHLLCNNNINEVIDHIDDRRQILNSAVDRFYTIEKTQNYTLASVFNPNTKDQVGRKAYIAITLFVKKGDIITGGLLDTLNNLMSYYENKQGNEAVNKFTVQMFEAEYANLGVEKGKMKNIDIAKKQGYFIYESIESINEYFDYPEINSFKKIYFLNKNNSAVINELFSFEEVKSFPQSISFQISDFNTIKYELLINKEPYSTAGMLSIGNLIVLAHQGDRISILKKHNNQSKNLNTPLNGQTISIYNIFPEDIIKQESAGNIKNTGGANLNSRKIIKDKNNKIDRILKIAILVLLVVIGVILYLNFVGDQPEEGANQTNGDTATPSANIDSPTTNTATPSANIDSPTTNTATPSASAEIKKETVKKSDTVKKEKTQPNQRNNVDNQKSDPNCETCKGLKRKIKGPQNSENYKKAKAKYEEHIKKLH